MQVTQIVRHDTLPDMPSATNDDHDGRYYTKDEVNDIVEGNTFDFFLNNTNSDISAPIQYFVMDPTETGEGASTFSDTITGDAFLIDSWATSTSEPTFSALVSGIYAFHIHAETTTGANVGTVRLYWELYRRTHPGGAETLLITSEESNVLVGAELEYDIHGTLATDFMLDATDRLVLKVYANIETSRPTDPLVTLTAEGSTAAHFEVVTTITAFDDRYVQVAGDTMTGPLNMSSDINIADTHHLLIGHDSLIPIISGSPEVQVLGTGFTDSSIAILRAADTVSPPALVLTKARGTLADRVAIVSGDDLGAIRAVGHDGFDLNTVSSDIIFCTEGTIAQNQIPGVMKFRTADSSGTRQDALILDSSQNATFGANIIIPNGRFIGSVGFPQALQILADGTLTIDDDAFIGSDTTVNAIQIEQDGDIVLVKDLSVGGTIGAGAITGTSLTDGTAVIAGGNYNSIGSIVLTTTTAGSLKVQSEAANPSVRGLLEVVANASTPLPAATVSGIASEVFHLPESVPDLQDFSIAGFFSNISAGATKADGSGGDFRGLFGGCEVALTVGSPPLFVGTSPSVMALQFTASNQDDWITSAGGVPSIMNTTGANIKSFLGWGGKTISGTQAQAINEGICAIAIMDGLYNADRDGANYGLKIITTDSLHDDSTGDIDCYGLHITAAASSTHGGGGVLRSRGAYIEKGVFLAEQTTASPDKASSGQIWTKDNAGTTELWFTDDNGNDNQIAYV